MTLVKVRNNLLKDEKRAGLKVTRGFFLARSAGSGKPFRGSRLLSTRNGLTENLIFRRRKQVLTKHFYSNAASALLPALKVASSSPVAALRTPPRPSRCCRFHFGGGFAEG